MAFIPNTNKLIIFTTFVDCAMHVTQVPSPIQDSNLWLAMILKTFSHRTMPLKGTPSGFQ